MKSVNEKENQYLSDLAYNNGDAVLSNLPQVLGIESTNHCNIKCIMCPRGEPDIMRRPIGHMSNELLERIIDQSTYFTDPTWLHWFGEPLMNPNLFDQIEIAKRKVPNLGISTNATLLTEENQIRILDSSLDTIIIAIDGATKSTYESTRKSARFTFEKVIDNAEQFLSRRMALSKTRPHIILSIIAMESTVVEQEQFREYWTTRGANEVLFKPFVDWGGQAPGTFKDLAKVEERSLLASPRPHACKFLWQSLVITWNGYVVPCCYDYDAKMVLGDLKIQTLEEIWNGPAYVQLRQAELAGQNNSALCANCAQAPGHPRNPTIVPLSVPPEVCEEVQQEVIVPLSIPQKVRREVRRIVTQARRVAGP